ncbi:MAG: DegV family protein [Anaerolineales bacterium]|nr:DegV family protein [Anaerolineales bacterium]
MNKIAIVTDSTAYLTPEAVQKYNIHVLPLKLHWKGKSYLDGVEIKPRDFYTQLGNGAPIPTTSQPAMSEFLDIYTDLADKYEGILVPLISSGISGTVSSAQAAAEEFDQVPVEVIDSRITSGGLALVVLAASRAIESGADLSEAARVARSVSERVRVYFVVDTLKYLHKGGRIGGASRYLGSALRIKPILTFTEEGTIDALERIRTKRKAIQRLLELVEEHADGHPIHAGVVHAHAEDALQELTAQLNGCVSCKELHQYELSPVIGAHVGPGTLGVTFYADGK